MRKCFFWKIFGGLEFHAKRGRFFGDKFLSHEEDKVFIFGNFFLLVVTKEEV